MLFHLSACNCGQCFGMAAGTKSQMVFFGVTFAVALWVMWAFVEWLPEKVVPESEDRIQMYEQRRNGEEGAEGEPFAPVMLVFEHCESSFVDTEEFFRCDNKTKLLVPVFTFSDRHVHHDFWKCEVDFNAGRALGNGMKNEAIGFMVGAIWTGDKKGVLGPSFLTVNPAMICFAKQNQLCLIFSCQIQCHSGKLHTIQVVADCDARGLAISFVWRKQNS